MCKILNSFFCNQWNEATTGVSPPAGEPETPASTGSTGALDSRFGGLGGCHSFKQQHLVWHFETSPRRTQGVYSNQGFWMGFAVFSF